MEPTFRLLHVRGIPVGAHWTWPVAFGVVAWTLARTVFPAAYPGLGGGVRLVMAVAATGALFASVVLHELAHAVAARREGLPVEGVTLWLLGGVSGGGGQAGSAGQELRVAAAGPVLSLLLAALFAAASTGGNRLGWPEAVGAVLGYVARLNVLVAAFNLIPVLPLDGGRILRAWLWHRQRDLVAATRSGTRAGQAFGATLVVVGLLNLGSGTRLMGVALVLLGGFLVRSASSELADARTRQRLEGFTARDVMASDPGVVLNHTPVARLVEQPPAPERSGYPVLGGGRLLGVVVMASARRVPAAERASFLVEDVMTPIDDLPMVDAGVRVLDVLDRLNGDNPSGQVVVVDDGCVVGILDEDDVASVLDRPQPHASGDGPLGRGAPVGRAAPVGGGRSAGVGAWVLVALLCLVVGMSLYRPPLVVVSAGPVADVAAGISIAGVPVTPVNGRYLLPSVEVRRTSALGALIASVRGGHRVVPADRAAEWAEPGFPGVSRETRLLAAAAAAQSQGLPARVAGTGTRVVAVRPGSPADGILRPGDVILVADGRPVPQAGPWTEIARRHPPGTELRLSVERAGGVAEVVLTSGNGSGPAGGIGITVETRDLTVELPFEVRFSGGAATGGPGGGLAYALAIADLLSSRDIAAGRTIAAAGRTVDAGGGVVGPVSGLETKADAAARAGAALFVVPEDEAGIEELGLARDDRLQVEGVASLARAIEALSPAG